MNNRKYSPRTNKITVRVTDELKQDIQKFAEDHYIPTARAIRLAIRFYLDCNNYQKVHANPKVIQGEK